MNILSIKRGLAENAGTAVAVVDGKSVQLNAHPFCPAAVETPCFYAGEVDVAYHETYGGDAQAVVTCYLLVSAAEDESGQALLDTYLSVGTPGSVVDAIEGTPGNPQTLGGACDDLVIMQALGYRTYQVGEKTFYGAKLPVRVIGIRTQE